MKTNLDEVLKQHMSVNSPDIPEADDRLIEAAKAKIMMRKKLNNEKKTGFFSLLLSRINTYQAGFAGLCMIVSVVYFSFQNYPHGSSSSGNESVSSMATSTVLASLSQDNSGESSANSSTVLTSIITFVAKN